MTKQEAQAEAVRRWEHGWADVTQNQCQECPDSIVEDDGRLWCKARTEYLNEGRECDYYIVGYDRSPDISVPVGEGYTYEQAFADADKKEKEANYGK